MIEDSVNEVRLLGKITKLTSLKYLPTGVPVAEFTVAVDQVTFDKKTVGYFDVVLTGDEAQHKSTLMKVGFRVEVKGSLWMRNYTDRQGIKMKETKIFASQLEVMSHEKK